MKSFADRLNLSIQKNSSVIVAGFDPVISSMPKFCVEGKIVKQTLLNFHESALEAIIGKVAGIKINTAFFEQYGLTGLEAMFEIAQNASKAGIIVIADAKRGDIGSTAKAYSTAFLGKDSTFDALTVNPYLGFDTAEVFIEDCITNFKGIFVLVKTSNPGSSAFQGLKNPEGKSASELTAEWAASNADKLKGECGISGLGAVVGATYPDEAKKLRELMPHNYFLIPGYGAQGGSAKDALSGFSKLGAGIINISRGLFAGFKEEPATASALKAAISSRLDNFNKDINSNL